WVMRRFGSYFSSPTELLTVRTGHRTSAPASAGVETVALLAANGTWLELAVIQAWIAQFSEKQLDSAIVSIKQRAPSPVKVAQSASEVLLDRGLGANKSACCATKSRTLNAGLFVIASTS